MPKSTNKTQDKAADKVFMTLAVIAAGAMLVVGGLAWWASSFAMNMVKTELGAQKIRFPEKLDPATYPDLQQFAGQQVDTGPEAKAYASYIESHLKKIAGGKVYAEVSAEAQKDPTNQKLQQQRTSLFQGETLRGLLLGNGYAFWVLGKIAQVAALVLFATAALMAVVAGVFKTRLHRR